MKREYLFQTKKIPWNDFEIGDSVLAEDKKELHKIRAAFQGYINYHHLNWKIIQRKTNDGIRIWRVK